MKKTNILKIFASVLFVCLTVMPASAKRNSGEVAVKIKDKDFKSEPGPLTLRNQTDSDLVIFAGKVEKSNVIGGIYKGAARSFNLSKIPGLPRSGSLLVRACTYEKYLGKARITEEDVIFTGLVVYNLDDSGDKSDISIFKGVDTQQQTCIYVSNNSPNYVLELRKDTPAQGEVIATLPPLLQNKRIYLTPRDDGLAYDFYPTFIYVNPKTGERTAMPIGKVEKSRRRAFPEPVGGDLTPLVFKPDASNAPDYASSFLSVRNETEIGVQFKNRGTILKDQKGIRFIASGRSSDFEIESKNGAEGQLYTGLTLEFDDFSTITISSYKFKPGYKYDIIITDMNGNYEYDIKELDKKSLVDDARISLFGE